MAEEYSEILPPIEDRVIAQLVNGNVFRTQQHQGEIQTGFPTIFVYSNNRLNKDPRSFLKEVIRMAAITLNDYILIIDTKKINQAGLIVSYEEDDHFKRIQPRLHPNEGTIRDGNNNPVITLPKDCYHVIEITRPEQDSLLNRYPKYEDEYYEKVEELFLKKIIRFGIEKYAYNNEGDVNS